MGNPKVKWTSDEEKALRDGIKKHGKGKWTKIIEDHEFSPILSQRSNVDLKDKWRNLNNVPGQGSRGSRGSGVKNDHADADADADTSAPNAVPNVPVPRIAYPDDAAVDSGPAKIPQDGNNIEWYNRLIFEALSTGNGGNGLDMTAILKSIEQRQKYSLPPNFGWAVGSVLGRLVSQGKIEMVQNEFKIKSEAHLGSPTGTPTPQQNEVKPQQLSQYSPSTSSSPTTPLQVAAENAAYMIAEAENMTFLAAQAMEELERIEKMVEECEAVLQLASDLCDQCKD